VLAAVAALLFYIVDPYLGIIVALMAPGIIGLDTDGNYSELLTFLLFVVGVFFVRQMVSDKDGE
jgi:hypothetical protein